MFDLNFMVKSEWIRKRQFVCVQWKGSLFGNQPEPNGTIQITQMVYHLASVDFEHFSSESLFLQTKSMPSSHPKECAG